jgi:hypothetical protein
VEVPDPVIAVGVGDPQVNPTGEVSERETVPEKPFSGVTVIVEVVEEPGGAVVGDDASTVKSWKLNVDVAE